MRYRVAILLVSVLALGLAGSAQGAAASREPQVICTPNSSPVQSPTGFYAKRPRSCNLRAKGQPAADAYMVQMRKVKWLQWGSQSALGRGVSLANMVGPVFTKVRLTNPKTVCGHRVFTVARFKGHSGGYGSPMQLNRRVGDC